jgi:hypothetical protein
LESGWPVHRNRISAYLVPQLALRRIAALAFNNPILGKRVLTETKLCAG